MHGTFSLWFGIKLSTVAFEIKISCCEIGIKREMRALEACARWKVNCKVVEPEIRNRRRSRSAGPSFPLINTSYEGEISKLNI